MRYKFTQEDIDFLKENYPIGNWAGIKEHFPTLSKSSIHHKCNRMGITFNTEYKNKFHNGIYRKYWTDDEKKILIDNYSNIPIKDLISLLPGRNINMIRQQAQKLGLVSFSKILSGWNESEIQYIIDHWELMPDVLMAKKLNRSFRAVKEKRRQLGFYRQDMNSNSYPTLSKYLRGQNQEWKIKSMQLSEYKCVLTGSKSFEIHHLYGVSNMISDILNKFNQYKYKPFDEYTEDDLTFITEKFIQEQNKYPLGECIRKDLHVLFHSLYGQYYNTPEQWYKFKEDYKKGAYINIA